MLSQKEDRMDIRIIGIDASLSCTGFAVADVSVDPKHFSKHKENLFKILTNKIPLDREKKSFDDCFGLISRGEIKEDKETIKELTAARKRIREADGLPKMEDLQIEESLEVKRITDQVTKIMKMITGIHEEDKQKTFIFIEDYSYHSPGSLTQLAEMKGLLRVEMNKFISEVTKEDIDIQSIFYNTANINAVKKVAALQGNADKEMVCANLIRYGYECDVKRDDEADAIAICLAGFYSIYHILNNFEAPKCKTAKEKKYYKTFIDLLNTFANRIGSKEELIHLLNIW